MKKSNDLLKKVRTTLGRYGMINHGDKIIVALSAGPDSICLLDLLSCLSQKIDFQVIVAHFDHGLRGEEDIFETQLSRDIAQSMNFPFETEKASELLRNVSSLEEKAREARYAFLEKTRIKYGAQKIATGHTLNDQVETILMRLLRGSGPMGLAGIPPVRDNRIIRPLIDITREEVMQYINDHGLPFATDSSNDNRKHLRNKIRLDLIPTMLEYQPRLLERLAVSSKIMREEDSFLESMAMHWIDKESLKDKSQDIFVPVSSIKNLPSALKGRVIRTLIKQINGDIYPLEYDHVESVLNLLDNRQPQCSVDLPNGVVVKKRYQTLHFILRGTDRLGGDNRSTPHPDPLPQGERGKLKTLPIGERGKLETLPIGERGKLETLPIGEREKLETLPIGEREFKKKRRFKSKEFSFSIEGPGVYQLDDIKQVLIFENVDIGTTQLFEKDLSIVYMDADKLDYPLTARNFRPGDRFIPLGMKGHRKVKDFFIDLKIPSEIRASTPILTSGKNIAWICGYRIDDRFKVTQETKKVLKVTVR